MLTADENERLTRVGPGTPAGELLRRYWHPVAIAADLTPESPTKFVRILGEDLVLFVTPKGEAGLLHDRCAHRGVSLSYGRVEERGIACAYHGWLYDIQGNCLATPAEPADSKFCLTVKQKAYPVKKLAGRIGPISARCRRRRFRDMTSGHAPTAGTGCAPCRNSTATGCRRWRTRWTRRICISFTRNWSPTASKSRARPGAPSTIWRITKSRNSTMACSNSACSKTAR